MPQVMKTVKTPLCALALLACAGLRAAAHAQTLTILDDFSVGISPVNVNFENTSGSANSTITIGSQVDVQRQIQESVILAGAAAVSVSGGNYSLTATDAQDTTNSLAYSNFTIDATAQHFLRFDFNQVQGLDQLLLSLGSGALPVVDDVFSVPDSAGPTSFFIDLSLIPEWTPGFASGVDSVTILFGSGSDNLSVNLSEISFTSIPEPSTVALMLAGLAAFAVRRRRSRTL